MNYERALIAKGGHRLREGIPVDDIVITRKQPIAPKGIFAVVDRLQTALAIIPE